MIVTIEQDEDSAGLHIGAKLGPGEFRTLVPGEEVAFEVERGKRLVSVAFVSSSTDRQAYTLTFRGARRWDGASTWEDAASDGDQYGFYVYVPSA